MAATNAGFVNINSDLGESFGPWVMGNDAEVLKIVKSANVACGFHASDPMVMVDTVKLCQQNGVSIGAHPGFADLQGFGRRVINLSVKELEANIAYQIGALQAIASLLGAKVTHMKPHGMMANMSAESAEMSDAICRATKAVDRDLIFLAQANTEQGKSARKDGLRVAEEVFADRTYTDKGLLTPRKEAELDDQGSGAGGGACPPHGRRAGDLLDLGQAHPLPGQFDLRARRRADGGDGVHGGAPGPGGRRHPDRAADRDAELEALSAPSSRMRSRPEAGVVEGPALVERIDRTRSSAAASRARLRSGMRQGHLNVTVG